MALQPSDFTPPPGHESLLVLAINVGPINTLYWDQWYNDGSVAGGATGSVAAGSDITLGMSQDISAVGFDSNVGTHGRFDIFDIPSTASLSGAFDEGGIAYVSRIHIIREVTEGENQVGHFDVRNNFPRGPTGVGNGGGGRLYESDWTDNHVSWQGNALGSFSTVASQVVNGDSVIIAITRAIRPAQLTPPSFVAPPGRESVVVMGITIGDLGDGDGQGGTADYIEWYQADPANGSLLMQSDATLIDDQLVTRVRYLANNYLGVQDSRVVFNLNDNPSTVNLSDTFGEGGLCENAWFHLATEHGAWYAPVGEDADIDVGSNFVSLRFNQGPFRALADFVEEGDSVLLALTIPATESSAELTGGLSGSVSAAGEVVTPSVDAAGELTGGLAGSVSAAGALVVPPVEAAGSLTGGLAGSVSAAGALVAAPMFTWNPPAAHVEGRETAILMGIVVGSDDIWLRTDASTTGTLQPGSDTTIEGDQHITRVRWFDQQITSQFLLNDNPSPVSIGNQFASGGVFEHGRIHIQNAENVHAYFNVGDTDDISVNPGGNFIRWTIQGTGGGSNFFTAGRAVRAGESIVIAITVPAVSDVEGAASLTGSLAGSVAGAGAIVVHDRESEASLTGNLAGSVAGAGALVQNAAASLTGALSGSVDAVGAISTPPVLAAGSLTGSLSGSVAGAGAVVAHDRESSASLTGGLSGYVAGDGAVLLLVQNAAGSLTGGLSGSVSGAGAVITAPPALAAASLTGSLAGSVAGDGAIVVHDRETSAELTGGLSGSVSAAGGLVANAAASLTGSLAGSVSGAGALVAAPTLSLSDFAVPAGREIVAALLITVESATEWWGGSAALGAGSDTLIQGDQNITRVRWRYEHELLINDTSDIEFRDSFGTGGGADNPRWHLLRALPGGADPAEASFDESDSGVTESLGGGFARWDLPSGHAFRNLANQVVAGDIVLLAITRARTDAAASLTGGLTGSIGADGAVVALDRETSAELTGGMAGSIAATPAVIHKAAASLTGGLSGSIGADGFILEPAGAEGAAELTGSLSGSVSGAGEIVIHDQETSAELTGNLDGSVAAAGALVQNAAGSLSGGLSGSIGADGFILEPAAAETTASLIGGLVGLITASDGQIVPPETGRATLTGGLTGSVVAEAELIIPPVEAAAELTGGLSGSVSGAGAVIDALPVLAAAELTGSLVGLITASDGEIVPPETGRATLTGGLSGSVSGVGALVANAAGSLNGGLSGSIGAAAEIIVPPASVGTAELTGGLAGSVSAAGAVVLPGAAAAELTGGLAGSVLAIATIHIDVPPPANATQDQQAKKIEAWGESGDRATPESLGMSRDVGFGRGFSLAGGGGYPRRLYNQLRREITGAVLTFMREGIPSWDAEVDYNDKAFVIHNSDLWVSLSATTGDEPSDDSTVWRRY